MLTLNQKKELIVKVLTVIESGSFTYMCNAIEYFADSKFNAFKILPEIVKYRPKEVSSNGTSPWFYFDEEGKQSRIKILKSLQEELNGQHTNEV